MSEDKPTLAERLDAKINKNVPDNHWMWTASVQNGHGIIYRDGAYVRAEVAAWELQFGTIPDGKRPVQTCGQKLCVNPAHLELAEGGRAAPRRKPGPKPKASSNGTGPVLAVEVAHTLHLTEADLRAAVRTLLPKGLTLPDEGVELRVRVHIPAVAAKSDDWMAVSTGEQAVIRLTWTGAR